MIDQKPPLIPIVLYSTDLNCLLRRFESVSNNLNSLGFLSVCNQSFIAQFRMIFDTIVRHHSQLCVIVHYCVPSCTIVHLRATLCAIVRQHASSYDIICAIMHHIALLHSQAHQNPNKLKSCDTDSGLHMRQVLGLHGRQRFPESHNSFKISQNSHYLA